MIYGLVEGISEGEMGDGGWKDGNRGADVAQSEVGDGGRKRDDRRGKECGRVRSVREWGRERGRERRRALWGEK